MTIGQQEFETILGDGSKTIAGDIAWVEDMDHSPAREFRATVASDAGRPLLVVGRYSAAAGTLSYALIHRGAGRIYALTSGLSIVIRTAGLWARSTSIAGRRVSVINKPTYRKTSPNPGTNL